ncbi:MAG: glutathione binding-like protein [Halioglobus sp.]
MDYVAVEQAQQAQGLRLVLTGGLPAPWSEAAKGLFRARQVDYIPVLQQGGGPNEDVLAWTGHRNAPTAMYNDEPARVTALELINMAERLGTGPSLIPGNIDDRIVMFGLINEIAGENGMAWNARVLMFTVMIASMGEEAMAGNPMLRDYRYSADEVAEAPGRVIAVLQALSAQLASQREAGSRYMVGDRLTALDIYWACFSQMLDALPAEVNPMPDYMRDVWGLLAQSVKDVGYEIDPALLEHRDFIFPNHLQWPLDF